MKYQRTLEYLCLLILGFCIGFWTKGGQQLVTCIAEQAS